MLQSCITVHAYERAVAYFLGRLSANNEKNVDLYIMRQISRGGTV